MKNQLKRILDLLRILNTTRSIIYYFTKFDSRTTNPRRRMVNFYSQFIQQGDLCFDVGANLGQRTDIFLELQAKVISIEPQSKCIQQLNKLYGKNKNLIIIPQGIAAQEGFVEMSICNELSSISTMSSRWKSESIHAKEYGYQWKETEQVSVTTLDILINMYGLPVFCKIDVEGFEYEVLQGLNQPISVISFEFNAGFFDDIKKCVNRLLQIGNYKFNFATGEPSSGGLFLSEWSNANILYEQIETLSLQDSKLWGDIYAKLF